MKIYWQMGGYGRPEQSPGASHNHTNNMTQERINKKADAETGYTETEENRKGRMGPCGACEDTVIRDARELEEIVRLGARMRTAQKAYFRTRTSENLEESKRLEREFDVRATRKLDEKPTAATLFG